MQHKLSFLTYLADVDVVFWSHAVISYVVVYKMVFVFVCVFSVVSFILREIEILKCA